VITQGYQTGIPKKRKVSKKESDTPKDVGEELITNNDLRQNIKEERPRQGGGTSKKEKTLVGGGYKSNCGSEKK